MPGGVNNAKKIVIDEANYLAEKLTNGKSDCVETQGKAIALIVKMLTPLYEAEFVIVEDCRRKHEKLQKDKTMKLKLGPVGIEGSFSPVLILGLMMLTGFGGLIFVIGKTQNWW